MKYHEFEPFKISKPASYGKITSAANLCLLTLAKYANFTSACSRWNQKLSFTRELIWIIRSLHYLPGGYRKSSFFFKQFLISSFSDLLRAILSGLNQES